MASQVLLVANTMLGSPLVEGQACDLSWSHRFLCLWNLIPDQEGGALWFLPRRPSAGAVPVLFPSQLVLSFDPVSFFLQVPFVFKVA